MRLCHMTKNEIHKEIKLLAKAGAIKKGDVKMLAKACLREAQAEKSKIQKFAAAEAKKELKKTSILAQILKEKGQKSGKVLEE